VVIAVGAVIPVPPPQAPGIPLDKLLHLCEYLLLAWCVVRAAFASGFSPRRTFTVTWLLSGSYGLFLEGVQRLLPYRHAEWGDLMANLIGVGLGVWIGSRWPTGVSLGKW